MKKNPFFKVKGEIYEIRPFYNDRLLYFAHVYHKLGIRKDQLREDFISEFVRVSGKHFKEACLLIAVFTSEKCDNEDLLGLARGFASNMSPQDVALVLIKCLSYLYYFISKKE